MSSIRRTPLRLRASATSVLVYHCHRNIFVGSEDERLVAISMYLKLGWKPLMWANCMPPRWEAIIAKLGKSETTG